MSQPLDGILELLRQSSVADPSTLLKPAGRRELEDTIIRLERSGLRARVVVAPRGTDLADLHPLWDGLRLDARDDLILLFNGERWEARGWGLSAPTINAALEGARPGLRRYYARGLSEALEALAIGARGPERSRSAHGHFGSILLGGTGLAVLGLVGWTVMRRQRRSRERVRGLAEARSAAEQVFSEVILATEDMPEAEAG